jgi:hypothetical protein
MARQPVLQVMQRLHAAAAACEGTTPAAAARSTHLYLAQFVGVRHPQRHESFQVVAWHKCSSRVSYITIRDKWDHTKTLTSRASVTIRFNCFAQGGNGGDVVVVLRVRQTERQPAVAVIRPHLRWRL